MVTYSDFSASDFDPIQSEDVNHVEIFEPILEHKSFVMSLATRHTLLWICCDWKNFKVWSCLMSPFQTVVCSVSSAYWRHKFPCLRPARFRGPVQNQDLDTSPGIFNSIFLHNRRLQFQDRSSGTAFPGPCFIVTAPPTELDHQRWTTWTAIRL